jgi:hypothetical protein
VKTILPLPSGLAAKVGPSVGEDIPFGVGTSVEDKFGVEIPEPGVARTGVIVGKPPTPKGVSVPEERGGFCQM